MKRIDYNIVKIKNLIGIIENPTHEDLLFEIVNFLDNERNYLGEFKTRDVFLKTTVRVNTEVRDDINELVKLGYIEEVKHANYIVLKHLWEKEETNS